mgnify:CR=1 FL=1
MYDPDIGGGCGWPTGAEPDMGGGGGGGGDVAYGGVYDPDSGGGCGWPLEPCMGGGGGLPYGRL